VPVEANISNRDAAAHVVTMKSGHLRLTGKREGIVASTLFVFSPLKPLAPVFGILLHSPS
jgi:hypothetical protein